MTESAGLHRHFGLLHATALNVTMIVGAGVFITVPFMLKELPGPYALLAWLGAGALMIIDGMIWSELGAALPGSGGSYLYLLECYGRDRWGRLMAFLFIWQFLISGPLEVASGLIAMRLFAEGIDPSFTKLSSAHTWSFSWLEWRGKDLTITVSPLQLACFGVGVLLLVLLYRRITFLGRLTITFWLGVLAVIAWILIDGAIHYDHAVAFDAAGVSFGGGLDFAQKLGAAMILAMYSYLGYYNICYIGDEVRDPGKTIPRSIFLSAALVCILFVGLHLAMLGTVPWRETTDNLPATFMQRLHGGWAARLVSLCLIWSCAGSAFAALLGYSRIPYGAARYGHFFAALARVHPIHHIPHVSLLLVGGLTLLWSFFDFQDVVTALVATRILEQFVGQIVGVMLLRRLQPNLSRPFRIWLYPLPCFLALAGWLYLYYSAGIPFILLGFATLYVGVVVFVIWTRRSGTWPFSVDHTRN